MADKKREYAEVIRVEGGEFLGIQRGPRGALVLFIDPESRTTLAIRELEFSPQAVSQRLHESRLAFELPQEVHKSFR
jgi:hypothetical protein